MGHSRLAFKLLTGRLTLQSTRNEVMVQQDVFFKSEAAIPRTLGGDQLIAFVSATSPFIAYVMISYLFKRICTLFIFITSLYISLYIKYYMYITNMKSKKL